VFISSFPEFHQNLYTVIFIIGIFILDFHSNFLEDLVFKGHHLLFENFSLVEIEVER
jgi:hypothetical protein